MKTRPATSRYLLPDERAAIETRRHWMILMQPVLKSVAIITIALFFLSGDQYSTVLANVVTLVIVAVLGYLGYQLLQWRMDHFIVTNRRVLLVSGVLTKRTAVMPLLKVTDMTYEQTPIARVLRYGTFVFESAGQDQALSRVTHLPGGPRQLYLQISVLLFANYSSSGMPVPTRFSDSSGAGGGGWGGGSGGSGGSGTQETVWTQQTAPIPRSGPGWAGHD